MGHSVVELAEKSSVMNDLYIWLFIFAVIGALIGLFFKMQGRKNRDDYQKWKKFKNENKCELIEVDKTRFWGSVYTWKTKDGMIIKNNYKR